MLAVVRRSRKALEGVGGGQESRKAWEGIGSGKEIQECLQRCWQWSGGPGRCIRKCWRRSRAPGRCTKALAAVRRSRKAYKGIGSGQEVQDGVGRRWLRSEGPGKRRKVLVAVRKQ
jgi:hypothetical protein